MPPVHELNPMRSDLVSDRITVCIAILFPRDTQLLDCL